MALLVDLRIEAQWSATFPTVTQMCVLVGLAGIVALIPRARR
jgi:hypothetical protein